MLKMSCWIFTIMLISLSSQLVAQENKCSSISATDFMLGNWNSENQKQRISESWQVIDGQNRGGVGTTLQIGQDKPPFVENLRLLEMAGEVFFLAKTPQNQFPVAFKLVECLTDKLTFENRSHDFPNLLEYQKLSATSLLAKVSGNDGKGFEIRFERQLAVDNSLLVQDYVDAYNQKDIDRMMQVASDGIKWMNVDNQTVSVETKNKAELVSALREHFKRPGKGFSEMSALGGTSEFVSGVEKASRISGDKTHAQCSPVVYQIIKGKIINVWYFPAKRCELK